MPPVGYSLIWDNNFKNFLWNAFRSVRPPKKNPKKEVPKEEEFGEEDIHKLDEAIEEGMNLSDDMEQSVSEGEGEDLLEEAEKYFLFLVQKLFFKLEEFVCLKI